MQTAARKPEERVAVAARHTDILVLFAVLALALTVIAALAVLVALTLPTMALGG